MAVKVCKVDGCAMKVYHCDLCSQHYHRWKKYGDPCAVPTVDVSKWLPKGSYKNNPREYRSWKNMIARCTDPRHEISGRKGHTSEGMFIKEENA